MANSGGNMIEIIELLDEKNLCLEKFYRLNESELANFSGGNFDNLENFYQSREGMLGIIRKVDELIQESESLIEAKAVDDKTRKVVKDQLAYRNELVTRILSQDLQILSFIETAKSEIIKELRQVGLAKKAVGAYKSGHVKNHVDEEI